MRGPFHFDFGVACAREVQHALVVSSLEVSGGSYTQQDAFIAKSVFQ